MLGARIKVTDLQRPDGPLTFEVVVGGGGSATRHEVTLSQEDFERLSREDETAEAFIERCFAFLVEREPKESILVSFDVSVISRYFPEFEETISG